MEPSLLADWAGFLGVIASTAGALVGLVFVALSVNLARIIALPGVVARAAENIILLSGTLAESLIAQIPHQLPQRLGTAILVVALLTWVVPTLTDIRAAQAHTYQRPSLALLRTVLHQVATVPAVVAGFLLMHGNAAGMDWLAVGCIASILASILIAWVLLVEIVR